MIQYFLYFPDHYFGIVIIGQYLAPNPSKVVFLGFFKFYLATKRKSFRRMRKRRWLAKHTYWKHLFLSHFSV